MGSTNSRGELSFDRKESDEWHDHLSRSPLMLALTPSHAG